MQHHLSDRMLMAASRQLTRWALKLVDIYTINKNNLQHKELESCCPELLHCSSSTPRIIVPTKTPT